MAKQDAGTIQSAQKAVDCGGQIGQRRRAPLARHDAVGMAHVGLTTAATLGCVPCFSFALLLASTAPLAAQETVTIPLNGHNFTLPAGFTIEVAARSPLVERPVTVAFDEVGHLYVADSSGSNEKLTVQLEKKPHRIVRLDPAKNGVFTTGHVFADKMMFPEGTMWHKGSLYVAAPPSIWKLTDTKNAGVADERTEWYQGKTLGNCGNDLHGPWLGPDGWFYWTRGGFQPQKHVFAGKEIETRASILFRAKPDGSQREPIIAGGMDNPVGLAFTPGGEPILTNTFLVYPSNGQRDGLIHAVHGGVYGKDFTDVLAPHLRTSTKLMPVMEHLGPAAPTGIVRYDSDVFGKVYQDNMFVGQFNLRKVSRHILTPKGATFESKTSDFVVSDNPDFHPTDVVMDADGSLLIVDTGGWYKLCCPTSQLVKPDVLGAIYRVRKVGAKGPDDPRGVKIDWKRLTDRDLAKLLGDPTARRATSGEGGARRSRLPCASPARGRFWFRRPDNFAARERRSGPWRESTGPARSGFFGRPAKSTTNRCVRLRCTASCRRQDRRGHSSLSLEHARESVRSESAGGRRGTRPPSERRTFRRQPFDDEKRLAAWPRSPRLIQALAEADRPGPGALADLRDHRHRTAASTRSRVPEPSVDERSPGPPDGDRTGHRREVDGRPFSSSI